MTREDKELLLKDLCTRLPYKVIVEFVSYKGEEKPWFGELSCKDLDCFIHDVGFVEIKPYLFPISSMTAEQRKEYTHIANMYGNLGATQLSGITTQDWFDKNHLDYRGLIEKGLAIDATGLNIY